MEIRKATLDDMELLIKLRMDYLTQEKNAMEPGEAENLKAKLRDYFGKWIAGNGFVAFFAEKDGEILSCAFLSVVERPPRNADTTYLVGTVYNVFTYPEYRRRGMATEVMAALLAEAKSLGVASIDLLATEAGKPLYRKMGFCEITNYTAMRFKG